MSTIQAAMSGVPFTLLTAVTTGTSTAIAIPPSFRNHTIIITATTGTSAGAVQMETANDPNDANTWAALTASPTTVVAATDVLVNLTGLINFIRARVTTNISGGSGPAVTVIYEGAKSY
jgi:hypothetical protein